MAVIPLNVSWPKPIQKYPTSLGQVQQLAPIQYAFGVASPPNLGSAGWKPLYNDDGTGRWNLYGINPLSYSFPFEPLAFNNINTNTAAQTNIRTQIIANGTDNNSPHAPHAHSAHALYMAPYYMLGRGIQVTANVGGSVHVTANHPVSFRYDYIFNMNPGISFHAEATMLVCWHPASTPFPAIGPAWVDNVIAKSNTVTMVHSPGNWTPLQYLTIDTVIPTSALPEDKGFVTYGFLLSVLDDDGGLLYPFVLARIEDGPVFTIQDMATTGQSGVQTIARLETLTTYTPPTPQGVYISHGGNLKHSTDIYVSHGGDLKKVKEMYVSNGGQLKKVK